MADYERAYRREKERRARAEQLLEAKTGELFASVQELQRTLKNLRASQQALVQGEKLASLGVMAAGVAHEVNNPAGFVRSNLATLGEYLAAFATLHGAARAGDATALAAALDDPVLEDALLDGTDLVTDCIEGMDRIRGIVGYLQGYARADGVPFAACDLAAGCRTTLAMFRHRHPGVAMTEDLDALVPVVCNAGQVQQVLANLLENAALACPDGQVALQAAVVDLAAGPGVVLRVTDTGPGIPAALRERIFEPFVTGRAPGEGTGLGLSISASIAREHGGDLVVEHTGPEGTAIALRLPLAGPAAVAA